MNQRKFVLYIATSLDGYIATKEHSLDWLFAVEGEGDNGLSKFYDTIDTILLGRTTYDWVMEQEKGDFPYKDKECYVFSRTERNDNQYVKFVNGDVVRFSKTLQSREGKNIWIVGGGVLLHAFIKQKIVNEIIITIAPILLGNGIPLFINTESQTHLSLKNINRYNQFIELHYDVVR